MKRSGPEAAKRLHMIGRGIAFVLRETVSGVSAVEFFEARITMGFGEDGSGRDGNAAGIAFDQRFLFDEHVELHGVDEEIVRPYGELLKGSGHCLAAGLVDVPSVDARGIYFGHGPGESVFPDAEGEFIAAIRGELFGVVQADDSALRIENDGGSDDRAEERAAAGFIDSGDARPAELARRPLKTGRAETGHTARNFITEKKGKFMECAVSLTGFCSA